jgi:ornithine cyclodeaminase/alanine dehydrogenase
MNQHLLYLSRADVESVQLPMAEIIAAVETGFREHGEGRVEMPPKPGIHPLPDAFIHAIPAYVPAMEAAGIKWVSGFPQNMSKGLPYISGLLILNDPATGFPLAVMDCTWITAMRTGAATAVAAKFLARPESAAVAILGCGVQGRSNLEALTVVLPALTQIRAYDSNPAAAERLCAEARSRHGLAAVGCANPREACRDADVIVTAGPILKHPTPVIERGWLGRGTFLSPVDFDSYVRPEVFAAAAPFYTDDLAQQRYYRQIGYFTHLREPDGDLGGLVCGRVRGRQPGDDLTVAMNLGIALEDMVTAVRVYHAAQEKGIGIRLPV